MKRQKTLYLMIILPLVAWVFELISFLPLKTMFGFHAASIVAYSYCTLAGVILSVIIIIFMGIFALWKQKGAGRKNTLPILLVMLFWVVVVGVYIYCLFNVDYSKKEPMGPSMQGQSNE